MREEGRRPGEKVPASGFVPTLFDIGQISRSRAIGVFATQCLRDRWQKKLGMYQSLIRMIVGAIWMRFFFATSPALLNGQICITLSQDPLHDCVEIGGGWNWVGLSGDFPNCLTASISCFRQIVANLGAAAGQDDAV